MLKYKIAQKGQAVNLTQELSKIQRRAGINITGELDVATKRLFLIPRCGVAESEDAEQNYGNAAGLSRKKRYTLQGTKWQKKVRIFPKTKSLPVNFSFFQKGQSSSWFELKRLKSSSLEEASSKDLSTKIVRQAVPSCDCSLRPNKRN